ncbi:MAG: serine/threonine-protein kinase [Pseudomonadota bacterium]
MNSVDDRSKSAPPEVQRFGRYEILQRLATGGMAEILLARSAALNGLTRTCVLKRILPSYSADPMFVNMFIDEARITIQLKNANIVRLHEFGQHEGAYYIAMEYVDGTDLAAVMDGLSARGESLSPPLVAYLAHEVLQGLSYAHTRVDSQGQSLRIVHRDISPHNVLISRAGEVKITDFGIAAARNKLSATVPGTVMGKSPYMAPEQAAAEPVDARADLWAAGVIIHELLTSRRLFVAEGVVATIYKVLNESIPTPSTLAPDVPEALDRITMRALQRSLAERYDSALSMVRDLEPLCGDVAARRQELAELITDLEWNGATAPLRPSLVQRPPLSESEATRAAPLDLIDDEGLQHALSRLRKRPSVWKLVQLGEHLAALDQRELALSAHRTAAAVFAHQGLLVQALGAYEGARALLSKSEVQRDLIAMAELEPGSIEELRALLTHVDEAGLWALVAPLFADGLAPELRTESLRIAPTPLLGDLAPLEFAELAMLVKVQQVEAGTRVLSEGDHSDTLLAVAHGRLVVYCRPSVDVQDALSAHPNFDPSIDRVYVGALADGDFFGEFSFLTHRPRSATVETITSCIVLELDRDAVAKVLERDPDKRDPLLRFYKERVVELLMAKSPLFSMLSSDERRQVLDAATLIDVADGTRVVEQGARNDAFYYIKSGELEVYTTDGSGLPIFINKLVTGQFFGEIAALHGVPRTVSVRSMGEAALLCIRSNELREVLARRPRLRELFESVIATRQAQTETKVAELQQLLGFT